MRGYRKVLSCRNEVNSRQLKVKSQTQNLMREHETHRQSQQLASAAPAGKIEPLQLCNGRHLLWTLNCRLSTSPQREELRVIWGTRGIPGTVAPFRAWRGSRDLVAQSPKFHAPAVPGRRDCLENCSTAIRRGDSASDSKNYFNGFASGGTTSAGFAQLTLNGPMAFT
jgi:hypothetical protein